MKDPDSILNWYKGLLALRHQDKALLDGDYIALNQDDPNVLSYLRSYQGDAALIVINMSASPQKVSFDLAKQGFESGAAKTLLTTQSSLKNASSVKQLSLEPFAVYIAEISK